MLRFSKAVFSSGEWGYLGTDLNLGQNSKNKIQIKI